MNIIKSKVIGSLLLAILYAGFFAGTSFFHHSHVKDGVRISHSHPYSGFPEDHSHTQSDLILIELISTVTFLILIFYTLKGFYPRIRYTMGTLLGENRTSCFLKNAIHLRAPPLFT